MLDILSDYLDLNTTPEEKNHIAIANRLLERAGDDNYEHVIEELLMLDQDMDTGTVLDEIRAVFNQQLHYFFAQHAITVSDDLTLLQLAELAAGVLDLTNIEQLAKLFELADEEAPVLEKLCMMLTQTTRYTGDELLHMVEDVPESFLVRLKGLSIVTEEFEEIELVNRRDRVHAYRKFETYLASIAATAPHIESILRNGGGPALPFNFYVKLIDTQQPLDTLPAAQTARELYAAALVSEDGFANPSETVKAVLESYLTEPKNVANVMVEIRKIMMGYQP